MTKAGAVIEVIDRVAERLGRERERLVLVGAAAAALYATDRLELRPTRDVDLLTDTNLSDYYRLLERLRQKGFHPSREEGAPICRIEADDLQVDLMVSDPAVLGFSNRWYQEAYDHAETYRLPSGQWLKAVTPIYFLATKLAAYEGRGRNSPISSKDLEDVISALVNNADLLERTVLTGTRPVFHYVRHHLSLLIAQRSFEDAVFACFEPDHANQMEADRHLRRWAQLLGSE